MEHVKPWLIETVLKDLERVLQWREIGDNLLQSDHAFAGGPRFEDDGGNLRIAPSKAGQVTRISKFPGKERPIRAVLSDSETRINVTLEIAASDAYLEKHHREIHSENLGALLQLIDYDIVATSVAPRASQLILIIKEFEILGAGGSGTVGSIPRPIESLPVSKELLAKLSQQTKRKDASTSKGASTAQSSPTSSSMQSPISGTKRNYNARTNGDLPYLASQVPMGNSRSFGAQETLITKSFKVPTAQNSSHGLSRDTSRINDIDLRAAIWKKKEPISDGTTTNGRSFAHAPNAPNAPRHEITDTDVYLSKSHQMTPISSLPNSYDVSDVYSSENTGQSKGRDILSTALHTQSNHELDLEKLQARRGQTNGDPSPEANSSLSTSSPPRTPRLGKITMRDIKTPKDQDFLLEQPYAWVPPEPGQPSIGPNVPLPILNMFNARAERRAKRRRVSDPRATATLYQPELQDEPMSQATSDATSEQDEKISWPASPVRPRSQLDDLPPDSSPPRAMNTSTHPIDTHQENQRAYSPLVRKYSLASDSSGAAPEAPGTIQQGELKTNSATRISPARNGLVGDERMSNKSSPVLSDVGGEIDIAEIAPIESTVNSLITNEYETIIDFPTSVTTHDCKSANTNPRNANYSIDEAPGLAAIQVKRSGPKADVTITSSLAGKEEMRYFIDGQVPSTAPGGTVPYTQVRRTPLVNGSTQNKSRELEGSSPEPVPEDGHNHLSQSPDFIENSAPHPDDVHVEGSGKIVNSGELDRRDQTNNRLIPDFKLIPQVQSPSRLQDLKRKQESLLTSLIPQNKRLKFSDLLPDNSTQDEEELVSPAILADKNRREFFERRSSAGSAQASTPVSPAISHKISHATFQALAPTRSNRVPFSGPLKEAKTPSRLPQSSLRLDTGLSSTSVKSGPAVAAFSPKADLEDVQEGAKSAEIDDGNSVHRQPSPNFDNPDAPSPLSDCAEQKAIMERTHITNDAIEASPIEHNPLAMNGSLESAHSESQIDVVNNITEGSPSKDQADDLSSLIQYPSALSNRLSSEKPQDNESTLARQPSQPSERTSQIVQDLNSVERHSRSPLKPITLYDRFTDAYPEYKGNERHFHSLCSKLLRILGNGSIIPSYLLDDFVIRHKVEYQSYVKRCADEGEDADPYQKYYADNMTETLYTKKILNRQELFANFRDEENPLDRRRNITIINEAQARSNEPIRTLSPPPIKRSDNGRSESQLDVQPSQSLRAASPEIQMSSSSGLPKARKANRTPTQSKPPVFIDLTADDAANVTPQTLRKSSKSRVQETPKSQRILPWPTTPKPSKPSASRSGPSQMSSGAAKTSQSSRSRAASTAGQGNQTDSQADLLSGINANRMPSESTLLHKDPHSPYNAWKRQMEAITPGKGNSFASEEDKRLGKAIHKQRLAMRIGRSKN